MKKPKLSKVEISNQQKRVNLTLSFEEYDDLYFCSHYMAVSPSTLAKMMVMEKCRSICNGLRKTGYNPDQTDLFNNKKKKRGKK